MSMQKLNQYRKTMAEMEQAKMRADHYMRTMHRNKRRERIVWVVALVALALAVLLAVCDRAKGGERKARSMRALVTAYCPCKECCGRWADGVTATGTDAYLPGIAADRAMEGATIDVPGYGRVLVDDNGRRDVIRGNHIDVRFPIHQSAKDWGRQWLTVQVWE